jgi:hypothetical protein
MKINWREHTISGYGCAVCGWVAAAGVSSGFQFALAVSMTCFMALVLASKIALYRSEKKAERATSEPQIYGDTTGIRRRPF